MVILRRQISAATALVRVIRHKYKKRIGKPRRLFRLIYKLTDRPVGVFDRAIAPRF